MDGLPMVCVALWPLIIAVVAGATLIVGSLSTIGGSAGLLCAHSDRSRGLPWLLALCAIVGGLGLLLLGGTLLWVSLESFGVLAS